jgi:hypothetical protein
LDLHTVSKNRDEIRKKLTRHPQFRRQTSIIFSDSNVIGFVGRPTLIQLAAQYKDCAIQFL